MRLKFKNRIIHTQSPALFNYNLYFISFGSFSNIYLKSRAHQFPILKNKYVKSFVGECDKNKLPNFSLSDSKFLNFFKLTLNIFAPNYFSRFNSLHGFFAVCIIQINQHVFCLKYYNIWLNVTHEFKVTVFNLTFKLKFYNAKYFTADGNTLRNYCVI